jgi:low temperature requirement protein LtrA
VWSQFTWSANAVSGNGRPVRVLFVIATAVTVPMAASVTSAYGAGGWVFAGGIVLIFFAGVGTMAMGAGGDTALKTLMVRWVVPTTVAMMMFLIGPAFDGRARIVVWSIGSVIFLGSMIVTGESDWVIRTGHFAERHALIIIVALGEVIVAVGSPVVLAIERDGSPAAIIVSLGASAVFVSLLWWSYFDRPSPAMEYRAEQLSDPGEVSTFVRDTYTLGHAFITAGVIGAAAGLEEMVLHPSEVVELSYRMLFVGGLSLTLLGVAYGIWRSFKVIPPERIIMMLIMGAILYFGSDVSGTGLIIAIDVVFFVTLMFEERRVKALRQSESFPVKT